MPQTKYNLQLGAHSLSFQSKAVQKLLAQHLMSKEKINHIFDPNGKGLTIDAIWKGAHAESGIIPAFSNELGRLIQEINANVSLTDTIEFITKDNLPKKF